jgi:spore maturation protein CgeB
MKTLIIGTINGSGIGGSFFRVAPSLGLQASLLDINLAYKAPKWQQRINWHLRGKYPSHLREFSEIIIQKCLAETPKLFISTGIAPANEKALIEMGKMGILRINYLTDDPWNSAHYAPWFFKALPHYDLIISPRRSNINDILNFGCPNVHYLPFGFDHELFYPVTLTTPEEQSNYACDMVFAGAADCDRVHYASALIKSGINVHLYGGYWERYSQTKAYSYGHADIPKLRSAISGAKIALCLVRKANRDGNCMRTFEVPAVGGCMLCEDTEEHREIFGEDLEAVVYFKTIPEMVEKAKWLLKHDTERQRLAENAHLLITQGKHTYKDRLEKIISLADSLSLKP